MKPIYFLIGMLTLATASPSSTAQTAPSGNDSSPIQYEVAGKIDLRLDQTNSFHGDFRVFVNGRAWLIQTTGTNSAGNPSRTDVGTMDGIELCQLDGGYLPIDMQLQPVTAPADDEANPVSGWITTNSVPVGHFDNSFLGHLWLMFASSEYLRTAPAGQLTPVFDTNASPFSSPDMKQTAHWDLFNGPGSLPSKVVYDSPGGTPPGVYTVTASTNLGNFQVPTRFHFEQPGFGHKEVTVEVTAVRAGCSRTNLLPVFSGKIPMGDFNGIAEQEAPGRVQGYPLDHWPTVAEARDIYTDWHGTKNPPPEIVRPEVALPIRDLQKLVRPPATHPMTFEDAIVDPHLAEGLPAQGPWTFTADDIRMLMVFVLDIGRHEQIARERRTTSFTFLWDRLTATTQGILHQTLNEMSGPGGHTYEAGPEVPALIANMNQLLQGPCLYDEAQFKTVRISGDTAKLLAEQPTGDDLVRLNRLLLEDLFPLDLIRRPKIIADPASKLRAFVDFQREKRYFPSLDLKAVITLYGEDGKPLWTTDFDNRGVWDAVFGREDIVVGLINRHYAGIALKSGSIHLLPSL